MRKDQLDELANALRYSAPELLELKDNAGNTYGLVTSPPHKAAAELERMWESLVEIRDAEYKSPAALRALALRALS